MNGISLDSVSLNLPVEGAEHLKERYKRLIDAVSSEHAGEVCDEAKAFLECVFRTIVTNRHGEVNEGPTGHASFISLFDQTWDSLNPDTPDRFKPAIKKHIGLIGEIRNNFGASSHGQDGYDGRTLGLDKALYIARSSLSIAGYLYSQHLNVSQDAKNQRINYDDNADFNEYIDSGDNPVTILDVTMLASEALFYTDSTAYKEKLIEFKQDSDYESWVNSAVDDAMDRLNVDIEEGS